MKCKVVEIILKPEDAKAAGRARLAKEDDTEITSTMQAETYRGPVFIENDTTTKALHLMYRDGVACVNFENEEGDRVNYDYPIADLKRIKHIAN